MSNKSRAKKILKRYSLINWDVRDLQDAQFYYWKGEYDKSSRLLFPLMRRLIIEPLKGTEEYTNGEGKPEAPDDEQPKEIAPTDIEKTPPWEDWNITAEEPERDDDGYLIR